jgi:type I restriction-modification system DNA methylase subunit
MEIALATLVEKFERNIDSYLSQNYIEEQARNEFINAFFDKEILGWDVSNRDGHAEAYKDVLHEGGIKMGKRSTRAPDYTFRIGGTRKFFVEAKKPSVKIAEDYEAAFQLRRYAWSAKLPLSILTSFNEFAVYDCRVKPDKDDNPSTARILYISYKDYKTRWSEISSIFGKESVLQGSFDRFASKEKRGTTQVDAAFLQEIEQWRDVLARNVAIRNPKLEVDELNFTVQRTIDRIVFLRLCEDRGTEPYEQLKDLLDKSGIYRRLCQIFERADQKYNSGIFHFHKEEGRKEPEDTLTPSIKVDDEVLQEIISNLYYPKSPYEFSVLSVDILGNVYEQFLGKVIRLTEAHRAKVEEKPEVRKAGGVYYTPPEIVEYIVQNTVENWCKGKDPEQIVKLRIIDPACGSGSFLIGAYTQLLKYHRDWYATDPARHTNEIYQGQDGQFHLTTREKKRILLKNIYGVDKDSQAVEVTKLNLLMKVLEGENSDSLEQQQKLFRERALPDLGSNIKYGNSLIGSDFKGQAKLFDAIHKQINPFNWCSEFKSIMDTGGFDVVIGNPPYLKIANIPQGEREYFESSGNYSTPMRRFDAFGLFVERSIKTLLKQGGLFGMIIPSVILNNYSFGKLRKMVLDLTAVETIVNLGPKVFRHVNNDTIILLLSKNHDVKRSTHVLDIAKGARLSANALHEVGNVKLYETKPPDYPFPILVTETVDDVLRQMAESSQPLDSICEMFQGLITGHNPAYIVDERQVANEKLETDVCKPIVFGEDIPRYGKAKVNYSVIYLDGSADISKYPNIARRLEPYKHELSKKMEVNLKRTWWTLHRPRVSENFERKPKLLVQCIRNPSLKRRVVATLDNQGLYADHALTVIYPKITTYDLRYILGILNSELVNFYFLRKIVGDVNIKGDYLRQIPIRALDFSNVQDLEKYQRMLGLVDSMFLVTRQIEEESVPDERVRLERQRQTIDIAIDELVYQLYGLSNQQISVMKS